MVDFDIAGQRLVNQLIAPATLATPAQVVSRLGAVQAQDYASALWAIGLRAEAATQQSVEQAISNKEIVRTWPMRGTLHLVTAVDIRWLLALLTPRILANAARRHQQLELDEATFVRAKALFVSALEGGCQLTRSQMMDVLEKAGTTTTGQRGYHILWWAAQTGLICFGPRQGKEDTFVLLDEWLPDGRSLNRKESLAELSRRYFTGHGPATLQDFGWWSGLPAADAREGLEMVKAELVSEEINGRTYWFSAAALPETSLSGVHLLPAFDQYLLGYKERDAVLDPERAAQIVPGGNGVFKPILVVKGQVVGVWKRTIRKTKVMVELMPFAPLSPDQLKLAVAAAERYGRFLDLPVEIGR
jgi:hypothetical protein